MRRTFDLYSFNEDSAYFLSYLRENPDYMSRYIRNILLTEGGGVPFFKTVNLEKKGMLDVVATNDTVVTIIFVAPDDMTDEDFVFLRMKYGK